MLETVLKGVLPPVVAAVVFLLLSWRPWGASPPRRAAWGTALALGLGLLGADIAVRGWSGFAPVGVSRWLPHVAALAAVAGALAAIVSARGARAALALAAVAGAVALMLGRRLADEPGDAELWTRAGLALGAGLLTCAAVAVGNARATDLRVPVTAAVAWTALAVAILQSTSLSLAQLAGAVSAALGVVAAVAVLRPAWGVARGSAVALGTLAAGVLIAWRIGAGSPPSWACMGAAAATLASPAAHALGPVRSRGAWVGAAIGAAVAGGLGALAVGLSPNGFDFSGL